MLCLSLHGAKGGIAMHHNVGGALLVHVFQTKETA